MTKHEIKNLPAPPAVQNLPKLPVHAVAPKGKRKKNPAHAWPVRVRATRTQNTPTNKWVCSSRPVITMHAGYNH